jgi:hypothetical protein
MLNQEGRDPNAEHLLMFKTIEKVLLSDAPLKTQKVAKDARARYKGNTPLITYYFTTEMGGGLDGSISRSWSVAPIQMMFMASGPSIRYISSMTGETSRPVDEISLKE